MYVIIIYWYTLLVLNRALYIDYIGLLSLLGLNSDALDCVIILIPLDMGWAGSPGP